MYKIANRLMPDACYNSRYYAFLVLNANFDQIMNHIHNIADRSITCKDAD